MMIIGNESIINTNNIIAIKKYIKYPKDTFDDAVEFLIGVITVKEDWLTLFRFNTKEGCDKKFNEICKKIRKENENA